jgi:hypothetical protein
MKITANRSLHRDSKGVKDIAHVVIRRGTIGETNVRKQVNFRFQRPYNHTPSTGVSFHHSVFVTVSDDDPTVDSLSRIGLDWIGLSRP